MRRKVSAARLRYDNVIAIIKTINSKRLVSISVKNYKVNHEQSLPSQDIVVLPAEFCLLFVTVNLEKTHVKMAKFVVKN